MAKDIVSYFLEKGEPLLPKPKPRYTESLKVLETPAAKKMFYPESLQYMKNTLQQKAYQNKEITTSDYYEMIKPQSMEPKLVDGRIEFKDGGDYWSMVTRMFVEAGSEKGTGMNINDFAAMYFPRDQKSDGGRIGFADGPPGKKGGNYNPSGKNQWSPPSLEKVLSILKDPKYSDYRKSDFYKKGIIGRKTLNKYEKENPNLIKYPAYGKRSDPEKTRGTQNLKTSQFNKSAQGSSISMDKINNFSHFAPKLKSYLVSTQDTGPLKASVNRAAEGYDKIAKNIALKQEKLIMEKPKGWRLKLDAANAEARKASIEANKNLGKKEKGLKGTLGYFVINPNTGEFKLKGVDRAKTFAGISGDKKEFKKMDPSVRAAFGPTQSKVQNVIDFVKSKVKGADIKRASNIRVGGGTQEQVKDPLGGPDLINVKKFNNNPYDDDL